MIVLSNKIRMRKIVCLLMLSNMAFSQSGLKKEDIKTPENNKSSSIQYKVNINQSTGKLKESLPITSILCRSISYDVTLNYDGSNVFKQAKFQNQYMPTSTIGVGWNMTHSRIVVNTKETTTRDDDTFYFDGKELVCTRRPFPVFQGVGNQVWEFKSKSQLNYIFKYYEFRQDYNMSNYTTESLDYWEVTDNQGKKYIYGSNDNSRESLLAWGNWIGDSKNPQGAQSHTIVWNLSSISDQWNNQLSFTYFKVEQPLVGTNLKQTEASYLKQINSGTGEKIIFNYSLKTAPEYYEPNIQTQEPDAYQERYEKHFLSNVEFYNSSNQLVTNTLLRYQIATASGVENTKRYLKEVSVLNALGNSLPSHKFNYFTSGTFAGALKSKQNPEGGIITYDYENKFIFTNNNYTVFNGLYPQVGCQLYARYYSNNYKLELITNNFDISEWSLGDYECPMVPFFINRSDWDGRKWVVSRYYIPENIRIFAQSSRNYFLDNVKFVFEDNFYAMLIFNPETKKGNLYMFHKLSDGTWNYSTRLNLDTGGANNNDPVEDPEMFSGEDFIAIGTNKIGKLYTYTWNNLSWNDKLITQNAGKYYYSAGNNFIISLDVTTGVDMPTMDYTSNISHYDQYYIHYLNPEKKWQTKSWTSFATNNIGNIDGRSYFYPSNAMATFVADNNPEYLLKWDKNYNLTNVQNVISNYPDDKYPFFSVGNNIFAGVKVNYSLSSWPFRALAISGNSSVLSPELNTITIQGFGENKLLGLRWINGDNYVHDLRYFDPNDNLWKTQNLTFDNIPFNYQYSSSYAFARDLFISGKRIYKIKNNGFNMMSGLLSNYNVPESCFSGNDYLFGSFWSNSISGGETRYFYIDKIDGSLKNVIFRSHRTIFNKSNMNMMSEQFGGKFPLFTSKNMLGYRLIDNQTGNNIYDIVVSAVKIDNGSGQTIHTSYSYDNSNTLLDDTTVLYGVVKIEEKGGGDNSNGYIKYYYDNGSTDSSKGGLLNKEEYYNRFNVKVKEIINIYTKSYYPIYNTSLIPIYYQLDIKRTKLIENNIFIGTGVINRTSDFVYNQRGDLIEAKIINSEGVVEKINLSYGEDVYPFLMSKNMLGASYKKVNRINNIIVSTEKTDWLQNGSYIYPFKNSSGPSDSMLRVNNEIKLMDNYGNVIETSDARGLTKSILMAYNYKYPAVTVSNAKHSDLLNALEISYADLQNLNSVNLEIELLKLYQNLPKSTMIIINLYDVNGNIVKSIDSRMNVTNYIYDEFNRLKYITDKQDNIIQIKNYNFKN